VKECSGCGNDLKFTVIITIQKVYSRTYDEDGDLVEDKPLKAGMSRIETWLCAECGCLIPKDEENEEEESTPRPVKKRDEKSKPESNGKQTRAHKKAGNKDRAGERPTEKQLKYLGDLADLLEVPEKERESFRDLSKDEISDKLTDYYKKAKAKGLN
jgi:flagellar motility protein MotE (MotC chaperone)